MFLFHLQDAWRSIRRNPVLSLLVVGAIATGIGVSISMLNVYYIMASNPIPHKTEQLYRVLVDSWGPLRPFDSDHPERPPHQMTWRDATALLAAGAGKRQEASFETGLVLEPGDDSELRPFEVDGRATTGDFFDMFEVPFAYGGRWDGAADRDAAFVVVLSRDLNDKVFGGENSVGRKVRLNGRDFTVLGVLDRWEPMPRYYDLINSPFQEVNELFLPISLTPVIELPAYGSDWGWKPERINTFEEWLDSESCWIQYWVELDGEEERARYLSHLDSYAAEQKKLGRFERPINNRIFNVAEWLDYNEVVENDVKILVGLGFLFLVVCLLSSISLVLTKFEGRSPEVSLRRALGATRGDVMGQHLVEIGVLGFVGGVLGVGLVKLFLNAIKAMVTQAPEFMLRMDWEMIAVAIVVSILSAVLAALYPAWRSCLTPPARQLTIL